MIDCHTFMLPLTTWYNLQQYDSLGFSAETFAFACGGCFDDGKEGHSFREYSVASGEMLLTCWLITLETLKHYLTLPRRPEEAGRHPRQTCLVTRDANKNRTLVVFLFYPYSHIDGLDGLKNDSLLYSRNSILRIFPSAGENA